MSTLSPTELQYLESHIHDNKSPQLIISGVICLVVAYAAVFLRLLARQSSKAGYGVDDWLIIVALSSFTGYTVTASLTTRYGMGKHILLVTNIHGLIITELVAETLYNSTIPFIKLSILFLFNRIFPQRWFRAFLTGTGVFVIAYQTAQVLTCILQCSPVHKLWMPEASGKCVNFPDVLIVFGVINILTEILIIALPMPLLWQLKMQSSQKYKLSVVFLIGGCVCIASVVRITYAKTLSSSDVSYEEIPAILCSTVELSAGIVSACVPVFGPLTYRSFRGLTAMKQRGHSTYRNQIEGDIFKMSSAPRNSNRNPNRGWSSLNERSKSGEDGETLV